ncbi:hypothetical protein [Microbispora sp. H13382]|uniref:hypothetical protein n=1 Tax=Microbispora sp. H13382 TaxID=2729112 RepID=UPI001603C718|nr:hypothetical protein [Microbispora sp. H13382]
MVRLRPELWVPRLYLGVAGVAAVAALVTWDVGPLWLAVLWCPLDEFRADVLVDGHTVAVAVPVLLAILALKTWMLRQVLALPRQAGPHGDRRAVWLRRLLYLAVAHAVVLRLPADLLPGFLEDSVELALWGPMQVLFALVLSGRWVRLCAVAAALAASAALAENWLLPLTIAVMSSDGPSLFPGEPWLFPATPSLKIGIMLLSAAAPIWQTSILIGQHRDGRWSRATLAAGWLNLALTLALPLAGAGLEWVASSAAWPLTLLLDEGDDVMLAVWLARSAHELAAPRAARPLRLPRPIPAAAVILPLLVLVRPEAAPRFTFTGWGEDCFEWTGSYRRYGDTRPEDREKAFLCHARSTMDGLPPMFPETLSDQHVLAYGRRLCAAGDGAEQHALLEEAGSERASWGADRNVLVFLCPEAVAADEPDFLRPESEVRADAGRYVAEENARCRDPWPRLRAGRQGTAAYFLSEGGGYAVHDPEDTSAQGEGVFSAAIDDGFVAAGGGTMAVMTYGENQPMCLTVKAFASAPPLRLKGWEQVAEVGVVSRGGRLEVPQMTEGAGEGAGRPLPNLAVKGPGRYRVRIHARGVDGTGPEEHLVVVFPGRSARKVVYR